MESTISVPIFTDEDEQRLATHLLLSAGTDSDTAVPAESKAEAEERAAKACTTLEGIQLLLNIEVRFHQHSQQLSQQIAGNIDQIMNLCADVKRDNYFGPVERFLDELHYRVNIIIADPKVKSITSSPVTERDSLTRLSQHLTKAFSTNQRQESLSNVVTKEIAETLEQFHFDQTNPDGFATCLRHARSIDKDLQEQGRIQYALMIIATALNTHAIEMITEMVTAFDEHSKAQAEKLDRYLQKFGAHQFGKSILAGLVVKAKTLKDKSHDQTLSRLANEISSICVAHLPALFQNKMEYLLQQYDHWRDDTTELGIAIRKHIDTLLFMKYTITDDVIKMAFLNITRDASLFTPHTHFSRKFMALLKKHSLDRLDETAYLKCEALAEEVDACVFMTAKFMHLKKTALFWLDYHHGAYNNLLNEMIEHIDNHEWLLEKVIHFFLLCGLMPGKALLEIIEHKLSHGVKKVHQDNLQKSHRVYQSLSKLTLSGTISIRSKSSKLLSLGKFANRSLDDHSEQELTLSEIRQLEKLRRLIERVMTELQAEWRHEKERQADESRWVSTPISALIRDRNKRMTANIMMRLESEYPMKTMQGATAESAPEAPHSNLPEPDNTSREHQPGSPYFKHN